MSGTFKDVRISKDRSKKENDLGGRTEGRSSDNDSIEHDVSDRRPGRSSRVDDHQDPR